MYEPISNTTKKTTEEIIAEAEISIDAYQKEYAARPRRTIHGCKISKDYGETWRLFAICTECEDELEPPTMKKNTGVSGVRTCDWCGAVNVL